MDKIGARAVMLVGLVLGGVSLLAAQGTGQLSVYQNYDFTPGDTILFADDFTEAQGGEFPDRWELKAGQAVVNTNQGTPAFYLIDGNSARVAPRIKNPKYLGDQFTVEFDFIELPNSGGINVFFETDGDEGNLSISDYSVEFKGNDAHDLSANLPSSIQGAERFRNVWHHVGIAVKGHQAKIYLDQYRILVMPDMGIVPVSIQMGGIASQDSPLVFTNFRLASGGGMNLIGQKFTEAKIVTHGINFDVDKATLRPESMGTLNQIKRLLADNPGLKFEIDGHTDNTGTPAHNLTLSQQRADAVKAQLVKMGVDGTRLTTKGFGDTKPIAPNTTPDGKANNRRVEFVKV